MYKVYCHIFPNGKRYVGITRTSLERRWGEGRNYSSCPLVSRAIAKYGWENISHEILCETDSLEDAEKQERGFIEKFDTLNPEHGYNILPGGDVSNNAVTEEMRYKLGRGWRGKHRSEEEKKRISDSVKRVFNSRPESNGHFGLKASDQTRAKMSETHTARWAENTEGRQQASSRMKSRMSNPETKKRITDNLAKYRRKKGEWKQTEEGKLKIAEANKGKWLGEKSPCSKPVLQFTKDGEFIKKWANGGEAERAGVADRGNISSCCNGRMKSAGGFVWRFEV